MLVNGRTMTIVGVAPRGFDGTTVGDRPDVYLPITMRGVVESYFKGFENRREYWAYLFARLKPGVTIDAAATALTVPYRNILQTVEAPLQTGMSEATLERFKTKVVTLAPGSQGQSSISGEASTPLTILFIVTGVVLLIACANIANLLLARSASRAGEMAVRLSIGASRRQLVRQLLTESVVLAVMGGLVGLLFARWTLLFIASMLPSDATFISLEVDVTVMAFAAALSIATGLLFGLFPALHSTRPNLASTLKGVSGQPAGARSAALFRKILVALQVTLSMLLLAVAGLFLKSLVNVSRVDLGLSVDRMVTFGDLAAPQRLRAGPVARSLHPDRAGAGGDSGRDGRVHVDGAGPGRKLLGQQRLRPGLRGRARHRQQLAVQRNRPRVLQDDGNCAHRRSRVHRRRRRRRAQGGDRQRDVREEVQSRPRRRRPSHGPGPEHEQARHRNRRTRPGCEVQRSERCHPADVLPALPAGHQARRSQLLRPHGDGRRHADRRRPRRHETNRSEPPAEQSADIDAADPAERLPRSHADDDCRVVCRAGDGARRDRALRRPGLFSVTAYARVRPADGARRRSRAACGGS